MDTKNMILFAYVFTTLTLALFLYSSITVENTLQKELYHEEELVKPKYIANRPITRSMSKQRMSSSVSSSAF